MRIRQWGLATTALTALVGLMGGTAYAQATDGSDTTEVVVVGIRHSLQSSVKTKKNTDAIIDVITAEDVGKFPDTNVAESLSHLPGISVDRNFGEGEKVSILGTDPALNRVLIDGHTIASADWGGNPNDPTSRTFNYSLLAPEIIGQAKVYKNPEAWVDEGSLGGTVIIETRKPLDLKSGALTGSVGYSYNDRSEKGDVRGSVLYSWHNEAKNFGVLVSATYDKQQLHRAGIEYFGYSGGDSFDGAFTKTYSGSTLTGVTGPTINGSAPTVASYNELMAARVPCCFNWAYFDQTRERQGVSAAVQWKPNDESEFVLTALHINGDYTNYNQSMYAVPVWNSSNATDITVADGLVTGAYIPAKAAGQGTLTQYDAILRNTVVKNDSVNLAGKWSGDTWKISGNTGYTKATGGKEPERMISFNANSGFTFAFDSDSTSINFDEDPKTPKSFLRELETSQRTINGVTGYYVQLGGLEQSTTTDDEIYAQVDVSKELSDGFFNKILFGVKASDHNNNLQAVGYDYFATKTSYLSDFSSELTPANLFDDMGGSGNAMQYLGLTKEGIFDAIAASVTRFNGPKYGMEFDVQEGTLAGYLQGNFRRDKLHGNIGLRVVSTQDESTYWETQDNGNSYHRVTVTQNYVKPLPAVNIVYDLNDSLLLKFGAAKVIARPRYSELAGAFSLNNPNQPGQDGTGGGGNPNLKPYESTNYEGSAEWYFGNTGMLTGELFYRDISSYVVSGTEEETHLNTVTGTQETYFVTRPFNAQNAKVKGASIQFQKDIAYGFGIMANYTYAEADTGNSGYNMPYLSKNTYNVIPYYEKGPLQVRLSYSTRSKYFTGIGRRNSKDFADAYTQVDLSASLDINDRVSIYANGQNLLDQTYYSFSSVTIAPTAFYKNGRRFMIGVTYKM